jgi:cytochrome c biogenesis protein CcdA
MIRAALALSLTAAVACSSSAARAENNPDAFAPHRLDLATLDKSYRRALARRNAGISLAIPGVALNILGTVLFAYGATSGQPLLQEGIQIVAGVIVAVVGLAIAVPGVVLWILGQDSMDVLSWRRRQLTVARLRPLIAPLRDGAALGLTLTF